MDKFNEIVDSFKDVIKTRYVSPFYGTFILSWLACNWEILMVLFFEDKSQFNTKKILYIKQIIAPNIWDLLFIPLLSTLFILLILPFFLAGLTTVSSVYKKINNNIRAREYGKEAMTPENKKKFEDHYYKILEIKQNRIDKNIEERKEIEDKVSALETENFVHKEEKKKINEKLKDNLNQINKTLEQEAKVQEDLVRLRIELQDKNKLINSLH